MRFCPIVAAVLAVLSAPAAAEPGLGEKVYGAGVEPGVSEIELRYGRLEGGEADGEDEGVLELSHGFSNRFYGGVLLEWEREPSEVRHLEAIGAEGIVALGHVQAIDSDIAVYGEFENGRNEPDQFETKILIEHRKGVFDGRLNLVADKKLTRDAPIELGYAASVDWELAGDVRGGVEAFGELGSTRRLFAHGAHFAGPVLKTEFDHLPAAGELGIEAAYLFALGAAHDETRGQARLVLEYEIHL